MTLSAGMRTNLEAARSWVSPLGLDARIGRLDCGFDVNRHVGEEAQVYPRGSEVWGGGLFSQHTSSQPEGHD